MRIKRYFGKTIREAIQKVRVEQGPDAVIMSNRKVDGGVEIIAAIDFDEVILAADTPVVEDGSRESPGVSRESGVASRESKVERSVPSTQHSALSTHDLPRRTASSMPERTTREITTPDEELPRGLINRRHDPESVPVPVEPLRGAPAKTAAAAPTAKPSPVVDPALVEMRRELKSLRGMLEQQMSGLVWGDVARRDPVTANLMRLLLQMEISPRLCREIAAELAAARGAGAATTDAQTVWRNALAALAHKLPVTDDDILTRGGVVALLGPTGVGKTTTIAKLAARYAVRHGARRVALVTTDNYRIGAIEQLRAYAKILDVPMRVAADAAELRSSVADFSERRLVLIDTAGMSQRDLRLGEQLALMRAGGETIRNYLVLSATTRPGGIDETIRAYRRIPLAGCVLTKVDEAGSLGGALSLLIRHELPVAYVSDGQRVPEDLYSARAHRLVSRSVAMMRREREFSEDESFVMAMGGATAHA
jgi:flagellar biosynthesis protein FlhF